MKKSDSRRPPHCGLPSPEGHDSNTLECKLSKDASIQISDFLAY